MQVSIITIPLSEEDKNHVPMYISGRYYQTLEGKWVKIINYERRAGYGCVKGDDGVWRYDRPGKYENGRVTGTKCYPPDPRNFANGSWLKHPMRVIAAFDGTKFEQSNMTTMRAIENVCVELDRLYEELYG